MNALSAELPELLVPRERECDAAATLADTAPGQNVVIVGIDDASPGGRRLLDLGFLPGTRVEVLRRAPLGDPTSYRLRGAVFCLRASEAALIRVRPVPVRPSGPGGPAVPPTG